MGYYYNSACSDQTCSANCCNYYGVCPDYYSPSNYDNQCWYRYSYYEGDLACSSATGTSATCCYSAQSGYHQCNSTSYPPGVIGGIVGGVIGSALLIVLLIFIYKKCRAQQVIPGSGGASVMNNNYDGHGHFAGNDPY